MYQSKNGGVSSLTSNTALVAVFLLNLLAALAIFFMDTCGIIVREREKQRRRGERQIRKNGEGEEEILRENGKAALWTVLLLFFFFEPIAGFPLLPFLAHLLPALSGFAPHAATAVQKA